jgi:zinc transport system substrate-binding protein
MRYIIAAALTSAATLAAAGAGAEVPKVVADIPPVHGLAAEVLGDLGAPVLLLDRGASEHDLALRPSQAGALAEADLVLWIGPELTPALAEAIEGLAPGTALGLLALPETFRQDYAAGGAGHDHDHGHDHQAEAKAEAGHDHGHDHGAEAKAEGEHDHGHDHGSEGKAEAGHDHGHDHGTEAKAEAGHDHAEEAGHDHGHDHSGTDPHAWLDPANARAWVAAIAARLSELDPANAATYDANAAAALARIDATEAEVAALLAPVRDLGLVTQHEAYGYFAGHFGLRLAGAVAAGDAAAPGAARLAALSEAVAADGGAGLCLLPEAQHDPAFLTQLAGETGVRMGGTLDPAGSTGEPGAGAWGRTLVALATAIAACAAPQIPAPRIPAPRIPAP